MKQTLTPAVARVFKRLHYPFDVMLMCVRWCIAYGLSVRNLEEMMAERVSRSTIRRCIVGQSVGEVHLYSDKRSLGYSSALSEMQGNQSIEKKLQNVIMAVISGLTTTQS